MQNQQKTKSFIRGGQSFLYKSRMFAQVMGRITKWAIIIYLAIVLLIIVGLSHHEYWYVLGLQAYSWILAHLGLGSVRVWTDPANASMFVNASGYLIDSTTQQLVSIAISRTVPVVLIAFGAGAIVYLLATHFISRGFVKLGQRNTQDVIISGPRLAKNPQETIRSLKKSALGVSSIHLLYTLPMQRHSPRQGILFHGSTGSGKTDGLMRLLDEIRDNGDAAIIYDKECTIKPYYFVEDFDTELNPLSSMCAKWDIWKECANPIEMAALATYMMPKAVQGSDPFWVDAARTIFTNVCWEMRNHKDKSVIKMLQVLLTSSLDDLRKMLAGTESENLVSKDIEKTAISIRAVMATYTKALRFLEGLDTDETKTAFAIKDWVNTQAHSQEPRKPWLFITSKANYHAEIKPLLSAWLGMALKAVQSLDSNPNRRIWIIMDEMPSLNRLEGISNIIADIRKFGGCVAIGIQSISQLEFIYGANDASAIVDLLNSSIYYRSPKAHVAEWVSKDIGEQEVDEVKESQSYGPDPVRDGNTFARQRVTRRVVSAGTISTLKPLECYVKLIGTKLITHFELEYIDNREKTLDVAFTERSINWDAIKTISAQASKLEKNSKRDKGVKAEQKANKENTLVGEHAELADEPEKLQEALKKKHADMSFEVEENTVVKGSSKEVYL